MPFPRALVQSKMLIVLSRIWVVVVDSISYNNNVMVNAPKLVVEEIKDNSILIDFIDVEIKQEWRYK